MIFFVKTQEVLKTAVVFSKRYSNRRKQCLCWRLFSAVGSTKTAVCIHGNDGTCHPVQHSGSLMCFKQFLDNKAAVWQRGFFLNIVCSLGRYHSYIPTTPLGYCSFCTFFCLSVYIAVFCCTGTLLLCEKTKFNLIFMAFIVKKKKGEYLYPIS